MSRIFFICYVGTGSWSTPARKAFALLLSCFLLWSQTPLRCAEAREQWTVPLFSSDNLEFTGEAAGTNFYFQLPGLFPRPASVRLHLKLRPSPELASEICGVRTRLNGRKLIPEGPESVTSMTADGPTLALDLIVPDTFLTPGWNRVGLEVSVRKILPIETLFSLRWKLRRSENFLSIDGAVSPLSPDLAHFPTTLAEDKLRQFYRHPFADASTPHLTILLPQDRTDAHLRTFALVVAQLGQTRRYSERDIAVATMEDWDLATRDREVILIGLRDQFSLPLPPLTAERLVLLRPGEGLIEELLLDGPPRQRRWILVAGADAEGLENAALTIGCRWGLDEMHASFLKVKSVPEVIETKPDQSKNETHRVLTLGRSIHLHGLFQSEEILTDWRLPIGSGLESNSVLTLHLQHSPELATPYSKLDVYLEQQLLGSLPLSPATAKGGSYRFAVPPGIVQQDPLVFTLRSSLDLTETDCATRHEENAWLTILPDSALDAHLRPAPAAGDDADLQSRLALDPYMRHVALEIPNQLGPEEIKTILSVALNWGRDRPSAAALWPDVVTYGAARLPPLQRLMDRFIILLGSMEQWRLALPPGKSLAIGSSPNYPGELLLEGRRYAANKIEPTAVVAQLTSSPWSPDQSLLVVGSRSGFAGPGVSGFLAHPPRGPFQQGMVMAVDPKGRTLVSGPFSQDPESLADKFERLLPSGFTSEESVVVKKLYELKREKARPNQSLVSVGVARVSHRIGLRPDRALAGPSAVRSTFPRTRTEPDYSLLIPPMLPVQHTFRSCWSRGRQTGRVLRGLLALACGVQLAGTLNAFCSVRPAAAGGKSSKTLVLFSDVRTGVSLGNDLEAMLLQLRRVDTQIERVPIELATESQIAQADYVVVFCPQSRPTLAKSVVQTLAARTRPTLWVGYHANLLESSGAYSNQFRFFYSETVPRSQTVSFRGHEIAAPDIFTIPVALIQSEDAEIFLSWPDLRAGIPRPIAWRTHSIFFFAAIPTYPPLSYLFSDLVYDFFGVTNVPPSQVLLRIDDFTPHSDPDELRRKADYLSERGHPFVVATTPVWRDPGSARVETFEETPAYLEALRYAQSHGGRIVLRGCVRGPEDGQEFWDTNLDHSPPDAPLIVRQQLHRILPALIRRDVFPLGWVTPGYAAARETYREIGQVFGLAMERVQLGDLTHREIGVSAGITQDAQGRLLLPENLGYVSNEASNSVSGIRQNLELIHLLHGAIGGAYIHSYQSLAKLAELTELLESTGWPFLDLATLDNTVNWPGGVLLTGHATHDRASATSRHARWKGWQRGGGLVPSIEIFIDPIITRRGTAEIEIFEFEE